MRKQHILTLVLAVVVGLGAPTHRPAAHRPASDHRSGTPVASLRTPAPVPARAGGTTTPVAGEVATPFVRPRAADPPAPPDPPPALDPWAALRRCESGDRYDADTGNGYYGAYQFTPGTWASLGFPGLPSQASSALQDLGARELEAERGWSQWPACARELGLA